MDNTQAILKECAETETFDNTGMIDIKDLEQILTTQEVGCKWCGSDNIRLYCMNCENVQPKESVKCNDNL